VSERDALVSERDDLADRLAIAEAASASVMQRLDETAEALEDAQGRAARLTGQLSELLEEQVGLQETTQAQRDALAAVRADLEATQTEIARLTGARGIYTVQVADSLSSIATFFYRNGNRWPDILAANGNLIDDPDLIFAGMVLIIPE
jgi:nucleoid-associated protein YgaU